jgi:hypothetical protein
MYYLIDLQNMAVVRKHSKMQVLRDLANIECANVPCGISDYSDRELANRFTDFELKRLYKSMTGQELKCYFVDGIVSAVNSSMDSIAEDDINHLLLAQQAIYAWKHSEDEDGEYINYRYKPASVVPETLLAFKFPVKRFAPTACASVATLPTTTALRATPPTERSADAAPVSVPKPAPTPRAAGAHAGTRGAASTVFTVADELWEKAGKPMEPATILVLRRSIMDELEKEYGIKRTTSSTALGSWQKLKLEGSDTK